MSGYISKGKNSKRAQAGRKLGCGLEGRNGPVDVSQHSFAGSQLWGVVQSLALSLEP